MKRVLIFVSCILLIVSISVPAFAAGLSWQDYIVSTTPGPEYDTNDVFIPSSAVPISWSGAGGFSSDDVVFSFTLTEAKNVTVNTNLFSSTDYLSVEGLDYQDSIDVHFRFSDSRLSYLAVGQYIWTDGSNFISTHEFEDWLSGWDYHASVDMSTKPENAVGLYFFFQTKTTSPLDAGSYSIEFLGISFNALSDSTVEFSPIVISPQDYLVNESSNGSTSTLFVSVPSTDLEVLWTLLRDDDYSVLSQLYGNPFPVHWDRYDYDYWVGCQVFDKLDITDIVDGSTMNVKFDISPTVGDAQPSVGSVRYQVRYFDNAGTLLDTVYFFTVPDATWFTDTSLDLVIDKPEGAVAMTFIVQFMDISSEQLPVSFTLDLESVDFVCDIPTMVRVQQETGRTNQLLNELVNGDHGFDSSGSNFGSDADNLAGAGDQMDDAMGSGMDSLGAMTNSPMFTGTLATLAGAMDAIFVGHEITICGVTANPFTLAATILAIAILLPLALKYVFRKRGSG